MADCFNCDLTDCYQLKTGLFTEATVRLLTNTPLTLCVALGIFLLKNTRQSLITIKYTPKLLYSHIDKMCFIMLLLSSKPKLLWWNTMIFVLILQNDALKRKVLIHSTRMSLLVKLVKSSEHCCNIHWWCNTALLAKDQKKQPSFERNFITTYFPSLCLDNDNIETVF